MSTGENEQALRSIIDFIRLASVVVLGIHFYFFCYQAFYQWGLTSKLTDSMLTSWMTSGLFSNLHRSKLLVVGLLVISLIGARGKKEAHITLKLIAILTGSGILLFFLGALTFLLTMQIPF
jgi:hypothetical protein